MEPVLHKHGLSGSTNRTFDGDPPPSDQLEAIARQHYANNFPNPERLDCPGDGVLRRMVFSGKLPDDALRAHLFECSECYRQLQAEHAAFHAAVPAPHVSFWQHVYNFITLRPAPVASTVLLILVFFGFIYFALNPYRAADPAAGTSNQQVVTNSPHDTAPQLPSQDVPAQAGEITPDARQGDVAVNIPPSDASPADATRPTLSPTLSASEPPPARHPVNDAENSRPPADSSRPTTTTVETDESVRAENVNIDLENYAVTRGGDGARKEVGLRRMPARFSLTLPEGSVKGRYTVSIVDANGKTLVSQKAASADGRLLNVTLDAKLPPQKYRLLVSHQNEPPVTVPIVVVGTGN